MVKNRPQEAGGVMANGAVRGEAGGLVVGTGCRIIISLMASDAGGGRSCKLIVLMALVAGQVCVPACQGKARGTVIERSAFPRRSRVTQAAVMGEPGGHVVWTRCPEKIVGMATIAICWSAAKSGAGVARRARNLCVKAGKRKTRKGVVVEARSEPAVHAVAHFAVCRELQSRMIRQFCVLE